MLPRFRRWGCGRAPRGALFNSPQKYAPDQEYKGRQSTICKRRLAIEIGRTRRSARARIAHAGDVWHFHRNRSFFRRWTCRLVCGFDWHGHQYLRIWISAPLRSYRTSSISVLIR